MNEQLETIQLISDSITSPSITITIGKGPSGNSILLPLPTIHFVFYARSRHCVPCKILSDVEKLYVQTREDKHE